MPEDKLRSKSTHVVTSVPVHIKTSININGSSPPRTTLISTNTAAMYAHAT